VARGGGHVHLPTYGTDTQDTEQTPSGRGKDVDNNTGLDISTMDERIGGDDSQEEGVGGNRGVREEGEAGTKRQRRPTGQLDSISDTGVTIQDLLEFTGAPEGSLRYKKLSLNTWRGYKCGLRRWIAFARIRGISALEPDADTLSDCIEHYHETGVGPSAIDTMVTAVSTVFAWKTNVRLGQKEQVSSLVVAAYAENRIKPQARYYFEPSLLLAVVEHRYQDTSLRTSLQRLATLLVLCHAMRFTEMEGIMKEEIIMDIEDREVTFMINLKTARRRKTRITIKGVPERPGVCVVRAMRRAMEKGKNMRPELFVTAEETGMSASTISKMVREVMNEGGIPAYVSPYNCKHVGLTKAWEAGASEDQLRDVARWSRNSEQFRKHYRVRESTDKVVRLIIKETETD
jgi:site-specific recombinase XerD